MSSSMFKFATGTFAFVLLQGALAACALAHDIHAKSDAAVPPAFDVTSATASTDGRLATFAMEVSGDAGSRKPEKVGKLAGAKVDAYVWPTKLDPAAVGFAKGSDILALAITAHPDFDDTPLFDENGDGDPTNDGANWHSHWVVLVSDKACAGGLKVGDISPGQDLLPATAPGLPLALDSPGMSPILKGKTVRIPCRSRALRTSTSMPSLRICRSTKPARRRCYASPAPTRSRRATSPCPAS